ncbi:MAG: zinc dependent phospholipase C family protein [Christensenellales bacterium]|jgi:hypothetical protein
MPNQITHYYHGQEVLKRLDNNLRDIVNRYPYAYKMGSIGPDILFVLRETSGAKIRHYANEMQYLHMYEVFDSATKHLKKNFDECQLSYMLGLLCHYAMDKRGHAYVNYFVEEVMPPHFPSEMQSALHPMMEAGLDEFVLLDHMNENPRKYKIADNFKSTLYERNKIGELYEQVINPVFGYTLSKGAMRFILKITVMFFRLTTDRFGVKKKFFNYLENRKGVKKQMSSSIRPPHNKDGFDYMNRNRVNWRLVRNQNKLTDESFDMVISDCVEQGVKYIEDFIAAVSKDKPLDKKNFQVNYEGVKV